MLGITKEVYKGILYLRMDGTLNEKSIENWKEELDALLYQQRLHYFVFNFQEVKKLDKRCLSSIENKLVEIYLNCGKVAICGLDSPQEQSYLENENLYFVKNEWDACNYLYL